MSTSIFVMAHKPYERPKDLAYKTMFVGSAGKPDISSGCFRDDGGADQISDLNPYFSELTGLYWIWKNYEGRENIGICHYRRYFVDGNMRILSGEDYDRILGSYDIITTKKLKTETSNRENYAQSHYVRDMDMTGAALKKLYPSYASAYDEMESAHGNYFGNLFVAPRQLFDEYCDYLFRVLTEASESIDITDYNPYEKRVYGFLAEFLLMPFVEAKGLKAYECAVAYSGEKAETKELLLAAESLLREKGTREARDFLERVLSLRPDLLLPDSDLRGELFCAATALAIRLRSEDMDESNYFTREDDLGSLTAHVRKCLDILGTISICGRPDPKDADYLKFSGFDGAQARMMVARDMATRLQVAPLDGGRIEEYFSP